MGFFKKVPLRFWVVLAAIAVVACLSFFRVFQDHELLSYDLRLKLRPALKTSPEIILIEISDDTLNNLGKWPLPRDFHASLISVLKEYGARLIVFDVLFSEPTVYDEVFSESVKNSANTYLPLAFYPAPGYPKEYLPLRSEKLLAGLSPVLGDSAAGIGHINIFIDRDGKIRRVPLFISHENAIFANLGLSAACAWEGADIRKTKFSRRKVSIDGKIFLPVSVGTSFLVNYPDTWQRSFRHFSYFEILKSYNDIQKGIEPKIDLKILKDKVCFIGLTATGTSDLRANPLENLYPMLGLQASVFNSIVEKRFINDVGVTVNTLINIVILFASLFLYLRFGALRAFFYNLALAAGYFGVVRAAFVIYGLWLDLFLPLLIIFLSYVGSLLYRFLDELRKREGLEKELGIARSIQDSFLPQEIEEFAGYEISASMEPAKFVAGDLYDIAPIDDNHLAVLIGDVSGKGIPASLIMAQSISLFRVFCRQQQDPAQVLKRLNSELCGKFQGRFVTLLYMVIDTQSRRVFASSAGHAPLLLYSKSQNKVLEIELAVDLPLGVMEGAEYKKIDFRLQEGDRLAVFTDGVSEARDKKGNEFGLERAKDIIGKNAGLSPKYIADSLKSDIARFSQGCPQHDDITLIVLGD